TFPPRRSSDLASSRWGIRPLGYRSSHSARAKASDPDAMPLRPRGKTSSSSCRPLRSPRFQIGVLGFKPRQLFLGRLLALHEIHAAGVSHPLLPAPVADEVSDR